MLLLRGGPLWAEFVLGGLEGCSPPSSIRIARLCSGRFGPSAQVPRLLNHSRFPDGRAHGFAVLANIGVLRAGRAQPLYLLTPPGRFAAFGGKCPQGTRFLSAHLRVALRFAQQPTGLTLPFAPAGRKKRSATIRFLTA